MKTFFAGLVLSSTIIASSGSMAAERTVTLSVSGMTCASCPYIVRESLAAVDGVMSVDVSMLEASAVVTFDDAKSSIADLIAATGNVGFPSEPQGS